MHSRAELIAAAPLEAGGRCRVVCMRDAAPVAWRSTLDGVYLVNTAATPVGDDQVEIEVGVQRGADLRVRSTAATVAWRSPGTTQHIHATVADGGLLDWRLEPMIATVGCWHRQHVGIDLRGAAELYWTEELLLGRCDERPGRLDLRLDIDLDGSPLLRHQLTLGSGDGWDGPAVVGSQRGLGVVVRVGPGARGDAMSGAGWARMPLAGPGSLTLVVADDLTGVRQKLAAAAGPPPPKHTVHRSPTEPKRYRRYGTADV